MPGLRPRKRSEKINFSDQQEHLLINTCCRNLDREKFLGAYREGFCNTVKSG